MFPKYIQEMLTSRRLVMADITVPEKYGDFLGYTFRLLQRFKTVEDARFPYDLEKLLNYAKKHGAETAIISVRDAHVGKEVIWSAVVGITDPVALKMEKYIDSL